MTYISDSIAVTIDQLRKDREAYIDQFRIHGTQDRKQAERIENKIKQFLDSSKDELHAQALFELATIQRIKNEFETAIKTYEQVINADEQILNAEIAFDAWIGIARSHAYGTRNHGAAVSAFERAIASAGSKPTKKQRYEIANYSSQLQIGRGELKAALLNGLEAIRLAQDDAQRFYAYLDTGDILQKTAESCDYRKLVDAKSQSDKDSWSACKRAVASAKSY